MGGLPEANNLPNSWPQIWNEESRLQFPWHGPVLTRSCLKDKKLPVLPISVHTQEPEFAYPTCKLHFVSWGLHVTSLMRSPVLSLRSIVCHSNFAPCKRATSRSPVSSFTSGGQTTPGQVETCGPSPGDLPLDWLGNLSLSYKSSFLHLLRKCILHGKNIRGLLASPATLTPG